MTPQEFAEKMKAIDEAGDIEVSHVKADELLCEVLRELGYAEGVKIFSEMDKWYA
jgi:hypothetical protein